MQIIQPTTPFGRRSMSLAMIATQLEVAEMPVTAAAAHKWHVLRNLCECKTRLGLSERALTVLSALLTFHPETALTPDAGSGLVVFPSNQQLSLRANGMAPATLRRHLAVLVEAGVIIRRDSPNGKRYVRRGADREIDVAFGFDLAPLVARAAEFESLAEAVRAERRDFAAQREAFTVLRRDVAKMIAVGLEEGGQACWATTHASYVEILQAMPRTPSLVDLRAATSDLMSMARDLHILLETLVKSNNSSANESQTERHIQSSKPDILVESETAFNEGHVSKGKTYSEHRNISLKPFPLRMVLDACPDIANYVRGGAQAWSDVIAAANLVKSMLGISPSAWRDATEVLGPPNAATVLAIILQKGESVRSAGGYLRSLVEKARLGSFALGPPLMALLRSRNGPVRKAGLS